MAVSVRKKRNTSPPIPTVLTRHDTLTIHINIDVLGSELLADRDTAIKEAMASAKRMAKAQLAVVRVRS